MATTSTAVAGSTGPISRLTRTPRWVGVFATRAPPGPDGVAGERPGGTPTTVGCCCCAATRRSTPAPWSPPPAARAPGSRDRPGRRHARLPGMRPPAAPVGVTPEPARCATTGHRVSQAVEPPRRPVQRSGRGRVRTCDRSGVRRADDTSPSIYQQQPQHTLPHQAPGITLNRQHFVSHVVS